MATPTQDEIARALGLSQLDGAYHTPSERYSPRARAMAQALADARERVWNEAADILERQDGITGWKRRLVSLFRENAIRKGEQ